MSRVNLDDSPEVLEYGRWVMRSGVRRWEPGPKPSVAKVRRTWPEEKRYDWQNLPACSKCGAERGQACLSTGGTIVPAHRARRGGKQCGDCGAEIATTKTYCGLCAAERRRAQWRANEERKKQRRLAEQVVA